MTDASDETFQKAFETAQASLVSENWFFEQVREHLLKKAPLTEYPTIASPNGVEYLLHLTRFLFFLRALDCTDAEKISTFIDLHNEQIENNLADPNFARSVSETKKAIMRPERKAKIVETVRAFGRPVFAIYEYGHFLIDSMSPKTTEKLIEDLRFGGLLDRLVDHRIDADQKRNLIESNGLLEEAYVSSLLMQRELIAKSMSEDEYNTAQD